MAKGPLFTVNLNGLTHIEDDPLSEVMGFEEKLKTVAAFLHMEAAKAEQAVIAIEVCYPLPDDVLNILMSRKNELQEQRRHLDELVGAVETLNGFLCEARVEAARQELSRSTGTPQGPI